MEDTFLLVALLALIVTTVIILTVGSVIAITLFLSYLSSMRGTDFRPSPSPGPVQHSHHHDVERWRNVGGRRN